MRFTKMQAYGNDYIYIETITQKIDDEARWARFLSAQHFGVGSDGMVLICDSDKADFRMRIFNPDGSEAEMCGNAIRSVAKYVYTHGFTSKTQFTVETLGGIKTLYLHIEKGSVVNVTAALGAPVLDISRVPVTVSSGSNMCIDYPVDVLDKRFNITAVSMGNPHAAAFVENVMELDLKKYGHALECADIFPQKANIEFAEYIDRSNIKMRSWERNCGETLACGTGCCVCVTAAVLKGICDTEVTVHQIGGDIIIKWDRSNNCLYMTGKTEIVFEGEIDNEIINNYR